MQMHPSTIITKISARSGPRTVGDVAGAGNGAGAGDGGTDCMSAEICATTGATGARVGGYIPSDGAGANKPGDGDEAGDVSSDGAGDVSSDGAGDVSSVGAGDISSIGAKAGAGDISSVGDGVYTRKFPSTYSSSRW